MIRERYNYASHEEYMALSGREVGPDDIEMGHWMPGNGELHTSGASTCVVIAVHNTRTGWGIVGHFSELTAEDKRYYDGEAFNKALDAMLLLGDSAHTSVWAGGAAPFIEGGEDTNKANRTYAETSIRERASRMNLSEAQLQIEWSTDDRVISVELDCATGILEIHDFPYEEDMTIEGLKKAAQWLREHREDEQT